MQENNLNIMERNHIRRLYILFRGKIYCSLVR